MNVIDWRNQDRTHNNIPPSYNIYVRYKDGTENPIDAISSELFSSKNSSISYEDYPEYEIDLVKLADDCYGISSIESHYESNLVDELEKYGSEYLTSHDYLLRIETSNGDFDLKKQTILMLVEIFAKTAYNELGAFTEDGRFISLDELLSWKLSKELVPLNIYAEWTEMVENQFSTIIEMMNQFMELIVSVKPLNYIGRIIISTTDDIESKVIKNYGGKKWMRITNFLRGVEPGDIDIGRKFGEDYVELRESSVPDHKHQVQLI